MFSRLKSFLATKKGQLGSLTPAVLTLMTLAIIVAITFIILANFNSSTTDVDATAAINNMTTALNDNLVANFSIIVIVVVFAVVLGLIAFFRTGAR